MEIEKLKTESELNKLPIKQIGIEPMLLIGSIALIIVYYFVFASLGNDEQGKASPIKVFVENLLWLLFIVLILLNGITYIFGIDVINTIKDFFKSSDIDMDDMTHEEREEVMLKLKEQVFHLPENKYTYDNAKAICNAYDSSLATYDQINNAYNKGADWCSYGWSENQMALFPTQPEKWKKLQEKEGHEHDCGRPGINGGFIDNKNALFGVNCYGFKPKITPEEARRMRDTPIFRKTKKELTFDKKVDYWRNRLSQLLVSPFNHNNWSVL